VKGTFGLVLLAAAAVTVDPSGCLENVERRTLDARARYHATPTPYSHRIIIVRINEETISRLAPLYGRWPWPRSLHGELVDYLAEDGAAAIGFDLLFTEPEMRREVDAAELDALAALTENADIPEVRLELVRRLELMRPGAADREFSTRVRAAGMVFQAVVLDPDTPLDALNVPVAPPVPLPAPDKTQPGHLLFPFPELAVAARGIGVINALPDPDGVYRRFDPLVWPRHAQGAYPALGLAMAAHVQGIPLSSIQKAPEGLRVGSAVLPLDSNGRAWLRFQGGSVVQLGENTTAFQSIYQEVAYEQILASKDLRASNQVAPLVPGHFKDAIVLVSAMAAGLSDLRATPFSPVTPGVQLHANMIDSLLAGRFLRSIPSGAAVLLTWALCALAALAARRLRLTIGTPVSLLLGLVVLTLAWSAYGMGWVVPLAPPLAGMMLAYGGALLMRAAAAEKERRWLRTAFGHYLAPNVLAEVLRQPHKLRLGGERRRVTVLFSDVAGFTTISERLRPEDVSTLLNAYLDRMTHCVTRTEGTLDKFVGDAVMAEWNAPAEQPDHAARACETALLMLEEAGGLRETWRVAGAALDMRVGINTGDVVVGNMGSHQIFDYTVIGNEVNTAARLEPLNKSFGTRILVSGAARREAETQRPGRYVFRALGQVSPKGRAEPLEVCELWGWRTALTPQAEASLADFERALRLYQDGRFIEAKDAFTEVLALNAQDGPAAAFLALCEAFLVTPPGDGWNGVYVQTDK
jgi:adenylate cyclase